MRLRFEMRLTNTEQTLEQINILFYYLNIDNKIQLSKLVLCLMEKKKFVLVRDKTVEKTTLYFLGIFKNSWKNLLFDLFFCLILFLFITMLGIFFAFSTYLGGEKNKMKD